MTSAVSFGVPFAVGNNVSLASVQLLTVNSTGTVITGTVTDLKAQNVWGSARLSPKANTTLIKPSDATVANYSFLYDDWTFEIEELGGAGYISYLEAVWGSVRYVRAQMQTRNPWNTASVANLTVIGIRDSLERTYVEDSHRITLMLLPVGVLPEWTTGTPSI